MKCDICGEEFKNLGVHKYQKHSIAPLSMVEASIQTIGEYSSNVVVDTPTDKRLSELINAIKELLRPYQNKVSVSYSEEGGLITSVEFTARIQVRR